MGLKVEMDSTSIIQTIKLVGKDTTDAVYDQLVIEGKEIRDLARDNAPVDDHDLEKAIIEQHSKEEKTVWVGIDPGAQDQYGKPINNYGAIQHEFLSPYGAGSLQLGEKSQAKAAGGNRVGGKFLSRAFEERANGLMTRIGAVVKRIYR